MKYAIKTSAKKKKKEIVKKAHKTKKCLNLQKYALKNFIFKIVMPLNKFYGCSLRI